MEQTTTIGRIAPPKYPPGQRVYFLYHNAEQRQEIVPGVVLSHVQNGQAYVYNVKTVTGIVAHQELDLLTECGHAQDNQLQRFEKDFNALPAAARQFLQVMSTNYEINFQKAGVFATMRTFLESFQLEYSPFYVAQALEMLRMQR